MAYNIKNSTLDWPLTGNITVAEIFASGDEEMHTTLAHVAAVDAGSGKVTFPSTDHGFKVGSLVTIQGSTAYNYTIPIAAVTADTFTGYATFVEETFINTETVRPEIRPGVPFRIMELRLHLSAVTDAAEDFCMMLDSGHGTAYDAKLIAQDLQNVDPPDYVVVFTVAECRIFNADDALYFTYANTNDKTWGLELKYQILA